MQIRKLEDLITAARNVKPQKIAVGAAQDSDVLEAVMHAKAAGIADAVLVGDAAKIKSIAAELGMDLSQFTVIDEPDANRAAYRAVEAVRNKEANLVMKGMIGTAGIMKAVLDKEIGLRTGRLLSHVMVINAPGNAERVMVVTDAAMNINPDLTQKKGIIENAAAVARVLGIAVPKVAVLAAVENVNPDMPATLEAAQLAKMADRKQIKGVIIDGPLALDNAVSPAAAAHKGIGGEVAGKADILVAPDIEAGNILYKSIVYFGGAQLAGLITGAAAPVVLTSRADSPESKLYSIALGVLCASQC